jgi:hypothetical protein
LILTIASKSEGIPIQLIDEQGSKIERDVPAESLGPSPVRVCLPCNLRDVNLRPCARDHLQTQSTKTSNHKGSDASKERGDHQVTTFSRPKLTLKNLFLPHSSARTFQRKLSDDEDKKYLQENEPNNYRVKLSTRLLASILEAESSTMLHSPLVENVFGSGSNTLSIIGSTTKLLHSKVTPAGAYHLSLKFGTLVIESGVGKLKVGGKVYTTNRGILVSSRLSPTLLADKNSAAVLPYDPTDRLEVKENKKLLCFDTCCKFYLVKDDEGRYKRRRVELVQWPVEEKAGLACMKTVYGAAFSGYPVSKNAGEEATIDTLVRQALSFHNAPYRSKDPDILRQNLHKAGNHVLMALRATIEDEVDKYLNAWLRSSYILILRSHGVHSLTIASS